MALGSDARRPHSNQIAYLEPKTIAYNTAGGPNFSLGKIPRGSIIAFVAHRVITGFSSAGTRVLTVGTNGTAYNNLLATVTEETASNGVTALALGTEFTQDTEVFVRLVSTGTAATTGRASVLVAFIPPRELS